jgi:hypothetical protein
VRNEVLHQFEDAGRAFTVERYRNGMAGPHLAVRDVVADYTVMTRAIQADAEPFWVSGYAKEHPARRKALATEAESAAAHLRRGG